MSTKSKVPAAAAARFRSTWPKSLQCGDPPPSDLLPGEQPAYEQLNILYTRRRAYASFMGTRPQTAYGLADSPAGLAAWLLDHGDGCGPAGGAGHLGRTRAHQPRTPRGRPGPRRSPGQHHPLLADHHGGFRGSPVLGKQGQPLQRRRRLGPGGRERLSRRELPGAAQLDTAGVSQPHLRQRGRQRWALRGLGTAATLFRRGPRGPQTAAQMAAKSTERTG